MLKRKLCLWIAGITLLVCITPLSSNVSGGNMMTSASSSYAMIDRYYYLCLEWFITELPEFVAEPIPVGCEVIDCCPGCPGPWPLDWYIQISEGPIEAIDLEFQNLPDRDAKRINVEGNGRKLRGNLIRVGKGNTILHGINPGRNDLLRNLRRMGETMMPDYDSDFAGRVPAAVPHLKIDKSLAKKLMKEAEKEDIKVKFVLEQKLGGVVVNELVVVYVFRLCYFLHPPEDKIDLDLNASNDSAVVLVDGRRSGGCVNDEILRGNNIIGVGNLLSNGACRSEVIVFSDDDAMQLVENVNVWTNSTGDVLTVEQTPNALQVPVTVWLMMPNTLARAQQDITQASMLFNTSNCGVVFNATYQDVSNNQNAVNLVGVNTGNMCSNAWLNNLQASNFYNAGQLNVYYVNGAFTALNCIFDRNICVVGTTSNNQSLAHEFGHSFSLGHTNGMAGIPNTNVMIGGGAGRTEFTEGQCFRCNVNPTSTLNSNGVRTGPTRTCPDTVTSNACPDLTLDAAPN